MPTVPAGLPDTVRRHTPDTGRVAASAPPSPLLPLPRHTFVFARPVSNTEGGNVGNETKARRQTAVPVVDAEREHQRRQNRAGVALAFHSSCLGLGGNRRTIPLREVRPTERGHTAAAEDVGDGLRSGCGAAATPACTVHADESTTSTGTAEGIEVPGAGVDWVPGRFAYSLGRPFHSQRVASARFVISGAQRPTVEAVNGGGGLPELRLVTGRCTRLLAHVDDIVVTFVLDRDTCWSSSTASFALCTGWFRQAVVTTCITV